MRALLKRFAGRCAGLALAAVLGGATAAQAFVPPMPESMDDVDMYLLTIGRGSAPAAVFGHTILRVVDRKRHLDMALNWGTFDFNGPGFIWNFYVGDLNYFLDIADFRATVDFYRNREKRSIVQDKLNFTANQKRTLMQRLIWNAREENLHYQYKQFYDNCATRPRDYFDEALGGKIKMQLTRAKSRYTFRDLIRSGSNAAWWVYLGLDQLTNDLQEDTIEPWNEMFLPGKLRDRLREIPAYDDTGLPVPGQMLLSEPAVIVDLPEPEVGVDPYMMFDVVVVMPLALLLLLVPSARTETRRARALGAASLVYGLWSGFWGTSFLSNWFISRYPEVKHNAGLLLMWPLDWWFAALGLWLLLRGRRPARLRVTKIIAAAHLAALAALLAGKATGIIRQDVLGMLASTGVLALVYGVTVLRSGTATEVLEVAEPGEAAA